MHDSKNIWLGILVAIVIATGSFLYVATHPVSTQTVGAGVTSCNGGNCMNFDAVDVTGGYFINGVSVIGPNAATTTLGTAGTITEYSVGGRDHAEVTVALNSATTSSPAIVLNPWFGTATSSIDAINVQTATGVTGTNSYDISTTTNCTGGNASSSPAIVFAHSVASGALDTLSWRPQIYASTTFPANTVFTANPVYGDGRSPFFVRPNECVTLRIATSSPSSFTFWTGSFSISFSKP